MSHGTRYGSRSLDVVFGLFVLSGTTIGIYCLWAVANWISPQGEKSFGLWIIGVLSFVPTLLAWLSGGVHILLGSRNRDVRLGVALASAHLLWWLLVIGISVWQGSPSFRWGMKTAAIVEPALYAAGATFLGTRWFRRRRHGSAQVVA